MTTPSNEIIVIFIANVQATPPKNDKKKSMKFFFYIRLVTMYKIIITVNWKIIGDYTDNF